MKDLIMSEKVKAVSDPGKTTVDAADSQLGSETVIVNTEAADQKMTPSSGGGPAAAWIGKTLGQYHITGFLGQGGMGLVLKGHDPLIERDVAIKLLSDSMVANETARSRFLAEARAVGRLSHANVVGIFEVREEAGQYYLVMEYVPGGSLDALSEQLMPCSVLEATRAMIDACSGLAAAHAAGLIHRDIKPANFLRASDGTVKVMDFGLSKDHSGDLQLTKSGMVVGTPFFMSPEQCESRPVDARSDIYSLGATYFTLLTSRKPYEDASSIMQIMYKHVHAPPPNPCDWRPELPPTCVQIVTRAMAKVPEDRYQSVEEMRADLMAFAAALSGQIAPPGSGSSNNAALVASSRDSARSSWLVQRKHLLTYALGGCFALATLLLVWRPWEGGPSASPSNTVPVSKMPKGEPIRIGVLHSRTGTMAVSELPVIEAVRFAVDEINEAGGVLGRPLEVHLGDGRSDDAFFAREAERLISKEKVVALFGCWTSSSRKAVKKVVEEHDHLLVYPLQYEGLEASPCILYMGAAPNQQILPALEWSVKDLGKKRLFLVGSDYVFPWTANEIIKDRLKELGGKVVGEAYLPLGNYEVGGVIKSIQTAKPDLVLSTINGDSAIAFYRALRHRVKAKDLPILSFSMTQQQLRVLDVEDFEGDYLAWTYFPSIDTRENRDFVQRFHRRHPDHTVTDPMEAAYVGVKLWAQAAVEAESLEPKKVRRALLSQRLTAPEGEVRIDPDTNHCVKIPRIAQVQADGTIKIVWTGPAVRPEPYPASRTAGEWHGFLYDLYTKWGKRWSAPEP